MGCATPLSDMAAKERGYVILWCSIGVAGDLEFFGVVVKNYAAEGIRGRLPPQVGTDVSHPQSAVRTRLVGMLESFQETVKSRAPCGTFGLQGLICHFRNEIKCEDEIAMNIEFIRLDFECAPIALDRLTRKSQIKKRTGKGRVNGGVIAVADERAPITLDCFLRPAQIGERVSAIVKGVGIIWVDFKDVI